MQRSLFIYYFLFLLLAAATGAINASQNVTGAGFGVSPSTLDFIVEEGSESSRQLIIYNTGKESEFNAGSSSPEVVQVFPSRGTLPEGGQVLATVTAFGEKVGTSKNEVMVSVNSHENGKVGVELGAAVAVNINVIKSSALSANAFVGMLLSTGIVLFGIAAYYASRKKIRQLLFAGA